jgi:hypothetical protein
MKHRVSFYRENEVVAGRAPRYMVDIESKTKAEALTIICQQEGKTIVVWSVYKSPEAPIRQKPSFVFESADARNKWYSSHKSAQGVGRLCHVCNKRKVERYKRICKKCRSKSCILCKEPIASTSRRRYCDACSVKRKEAQEKFHREKRAKQTTLDRIRKQIAWAESKLLTTTLKNCKLSSRFQGLRVPRVVEDANGFNKNRCRTCLQKFIDVQTVYLANLLAGEQQQESVTLNSLMETETEHAIGHAAGN